MTNGDEDGGEDEDDDDDEEEDDDDDDDDDGSGVGAGRTGAWKRIMATDFTPAVNIVEYHYKSGSARRGEEEEDGRSI